MVTTSKVMNFPVRSRDVRKWKYSLHKKTENWRVCSWCFVTWNILVIYFRKLRISAFCDLMKCKWWIGKNLKGSGRDRIQVIFQNFSVGFEEYHGNLIHDNQGPYRDMIFSYPKFKHRAVPLHGPAQWHCKPTIFYFAAFCISSSRTSVLYLRCFVVSDAERHFIFYTCKFETIYCFLLANSVVL
jgi:hypothetical protein